MKKLTSTRINPTLINIGILVLRVVAAGFMLTHGWPKLNKLLAGGEIRFGDPIGIGPTASLILAIFAEFLCSILVGLGIYTRLSTIPLMVTMSVAAFISHVNDPFGRKELALIYLLIFVFIFISGGGKYSVDSLISRKAK
ncbi:MAG: DoxX family protein [Draconibacterium sp.]